jgi:alkylation response protein AidB-like acyl-CoA dehydrogenase
MQTPVSLVENYLITSISPQAEEIDRDSQALIHALAGLGKLQLLGMRIPSTWGGMSVDPERMSENSKPTLAA